MIIQKINVYDKRIALKGTKIRDVELQNVSNVPRSMFLPLVLVEFSTCQLLLYKTHYGH